MFKSEGTATWLRAGKAATQLKEFAINDTQIFGLNGHERKCICQVEMAEESGFSVGQDLECFGIHGYRAQPRGRSLAALYCEESSVIPYSLMQ